VGLDEAEVRRLMGVAARGYLAEMHGEYCQCSQPDVVGRKATLCFKCGLIDQRSVERVNRALGEPHPFEPLGETVLRSQMCGFCSGWREDARHREVSE
jgi:hypothetical protein